MTSRAVLLLAVLSATLVLTASPAWASTFTVSSTADTGDATPDGNCDDPAIIGIQCTLREAMQEASANNNAPTVDVIDFDPYGEAEAVNAATVKLFFVCRPK